MRGGGERTAGWQREAGSSSRAERRSPELFLACLPGLEPWLDRELAELDLPRPLGTEPGGVTLPGDERTIVRANLELGLASRALLRVGDMHCRSLGELIRKTARLPWGEWLAPGPVRVRAESRRSRLYHRDAIAERVAAGIALALGTAPDAAADDTAPSVLARFVDDHCTLSIDTSGRPLHERGYRLEPGHAPLREDVARALVLASGWDRVSPLLDPFAGSGTIVIEAALLARRMPPGATRAFAYEATRLCRPDVVAEVRAAALARVAVGAPPLFGSDRSEEATAIAARNAARAGVADAVRFVAAPLSRTPLAAELPRAGAVASNPPLGRRLGSPEALANLYRALGRWLEAAPATCGIAILSADRRLTLKTGIPLTTAFLVDPGGMKVRALVRGVSGATPRPSPSP